MLALESDRNAITTAEAQGIGLVAEKDSATSERELAVRYVCKRCQASLTTEPEYEDYDWFLRCLGCGAKNLLALSFKIVGWRR